MALDASADGERVAVGSLFGQLLKKPSQEQIVLLLTVALLVIFSVALPDFSSVKNLLNLVRSISILGILGLGMGLIVGVGFMSSAGAVAEIDGCNLPRQQRRHERTHQRDVAGFGISRLFGAGEFPDLRAGKPFKGVGTRRRSRRFDPAQFLANFRALHCRGRIHPDGRGLSRENTPKIFDQGFFGI